ncbi:Taurine dioxygenase, alpha-ketoglutarate-dependent [Micromonospora purpureochromogenes]|uniref:Taurine dioxygenase, alpha-ketoglutarate-dependent n=1 Tax=Micromonospora purpureochromogenes TaxID=47872 RepID=A0A1C4Z371_9ACTN|nr:TauD/TfdA family dioxygenase [Micromonospora purpureochromogenes]SCF27469.1 Taurine dioxygenase, alpha-ketoglutarate-dependent [Micromonospora purpureochromogenes]
MSDTIATLPVVVENDGTPLTELVDRRRTELRAALAVHGGLLFRGFDVGGVDGFDRVVRAFSGEPLTYTERSSPRHAIKGRVYTSTDYPPDEEIFLHNENSYQARWPLTLFFYCISPPDTLGATPLADVRRVYAEIDPAVREEFVRRRWMLVRNFHADFGTRWQDVFGTDDRAEVEAYGAANRIRLEWVGVDGLRTRAVRDAVHHRPGSDTPRWFNHATFFHVSTLPKDYQEGLLDMFGADGLPANTYYGDGGEIPADVMDHLRAAYRAASVRFDYRRDDVLVVDNMTAAHGREPFTGARRIAVAMAEPHTPESAGEH